ncbi:hypothetical protein CFP56_010195, partial [Quercus suber]
CSWNLLRRHGRVIGLAEEWCITFCLELKYMLTAASLRIDE